jgi:type I restriction enzyme S subunit
MKQGWTYKKLEEICEKGSSNISLNKIEDNSGDFPLYGASGFVKGIDFFHQSRPYIGIVKDGSGVGRVDLYPPKSSLVGTMQYIFPKEGCELGYLKYLLTGMHLEKHKTGAAIPHIYFKDYGKTNVPLPSIEEQQQIVAELDLLSGMIEKQKAQIEELDKLSQSIFYDMFGDPITNNKGWVVIKFGDECTDMKYGTSRPACENGRFKYLRMGNITMDGHLDLSDLKTIDIPEEEIEKCIVRFGDILFNRTNSHELIGKTCMFDLEEEMIIAGYIIRVRLSENLLPQYIATMFNLPSFKKLLRTMAKGAVNQANINSKELASIKIPIPPLSLQQEFAAKIEAIEAMKAKVRQSLKESETLFNSRMDYYFN